MNRIVLFLVSFLSLQGYENTPVMENNKDSQYSLCYEAKNEYYYSTTCIVYLQEKLNYIKQMENDKPLFIMFFYEGGEQIYFVVTDIKKNNIPVPQNSKGYCPGNIFELKGNCSCFYESGNKQESGICFYDEVIAADQMYHPYHFEMYRVYHNEMYRLPKSNQCQL